MGRRRGSAAPPRGGYSPPGYFSNHTGYGDWRGPVLDPSQVSDVVRGIDERGILGEVDAVLSGYQGAPTMGQAILDAVTLVRSRNPEAIYCCDPVMGDVDRGFYAAAGIPEFMREFIIYKKFCLHVF